MGWNINVIDEDHFLFFSVCEYALSNAHTSYSIFILEFYIYQTDWWLQVSQNDTCLPEAGVHSFIQKSLNPEIYASLFGYLISYFTLLKHCSDSGDQKIYFVIKLIFKLKEGKTWLNAKFTYRGVWGYEFKSASML